MFQYLLYADDILLLAPSISSLQKIVNACECKLSLLDLAINNNKKTECTIIAPRWNAECGAIVTLGGNQLHRTDKLHYLGVFIVSGKSFRCCFDNAKK